MAEGSIKKLTDKGFGFIDTASGQDMFFHSSSLQGVNFDQLYERQQVSFDDVVGSKN
ncbi:MAG: cold-shock protein [Planctomycetales bacterium]|jgi:CspA family cold shock protein